MSDDCLDCGTCDSCVERSIAYAEEMALAHANLVAVCAKCGKPDGGVFHRPPSECVYPLCEYDEAAESRKEVTGSAKYPHPTPHHRFRI